MSFAFICCFFWGGFGLGFEFRIRVQGSGFSVFRTLGFGLGFEALVFRVCGMRDLGI